MTPFSVHANPIFPAQAVASRLVALLRPADREPADQHGLEERDRVDLLVDDRLVPDGERARAERDGGGRAGDAGPSRRQDPGERHVGDEEPEAPGSRARERGEDVDALGEGGRDGERTEEVRNEDEERIARRVRQSQHLGGGHVLAGVPHRGGGRERGEVHGEHDRAGDNRGYVRWPVTRGARRRRRA